MDYYDWCPDCGGALRITGTTRISWQAKCQVCGRKAHLNDRLEWAHSEDPDWVFWTLLVVLAVLFLIGARFDVML